AFSAEVLDRIMKYLSLKEKLSLREVSRALNITLSPLIPELYSFAIENMNIMQNMKSLHFKIDIRDCQSDKFFAEMQPRVERMWRGDSRDKGMSRFFLTLSNYSRDTHLFERARIKTLTVDKRMTFHLTTENLLWLRNFFKGCKIESMSLVVEKDTLPQVKLIPDLLSLVKPTCVEFTLQTLHSCDMLEPFKQLISRALLPPAA
ncbi:hypothetical protein PFISCL1PPCAC_3300, partial [Pristionchus fissidentatus]